VLASDHITVCTQGGGSYAALLSSVPSAATLTYRRRYGRRWRPADLHAHLLCSLKPAVVAPPS
jgi:hypothetical protein